jgi:Lamin Tail Domain
MNTRLRPSNPPVSRGLTATPKLVRATIRNGAMILAAVACLAGCGDYSNAVYQPIDPTGTSTVPVLTSISLSLPVETIEAAETITATAVGLDQFGHPIATGPVTFSSSKPEVAGIGSANGEIFGRTSGATEITATIGSTSAHHTLLVAKPPIRINEIFPNGDVPGGFVELVNPTDHDIDLGGWSLSSSRVFATVILPAGFIISAHGYVVISEGNFPEGLKSTDAVHLLSRFGVQVDEYAWLSNPQLDYSRCPEIDGPFVFSVPTRKAANDCTSATATTPSRSPRGTSSGT